MHKAAGWAFVLLLTATFGTVMPAEVQTIVRTRVVLEDGGSPEARVKIGIALTAVMQEMNRFAVGRGNDDSLRQHCTAEGFKALKDMVENTGCFSTIAEYRTNLLENPNGQYEVRGIKVRVEKDDTNRGEPIQYLVFGLDTNAPEKIVSVRFAIEAEFYERFIEQGQKLNDAFNRKIVLNLLEEFRTAHNKKDIDYLERIYSEDALIIVGRVLEKRKDRNNDALLKGLGDDKVQFIKLSKRQYLERLQLAFARNAFVKVFFDRAEITRHPRFPDIYGVNVRQRWNSSTYNDSGYLFIMMDFRNKERPLIRVRSWQPEPFRDGTVIRLGDFEIVRD